MNRIDGEIMALRWILTELPLPTDNTQDIQATSSTAERHTAIRNNAEQQGYEIDFSSRDCPVCRNRLLVLFHFSQPVRWLCRDCKILFSEEQIHD